MVDAAAWKRSMRRIREPFYEDMIGTAGCGPFDGGCLVFAHALQSVIGGEIVVLTRAGDLADHAAIYADARLWDWDGPLPPHRFIQRFNRNERTFSVDWRPIRDGDLPRACRNPVLAFRLADLLRTALRGVP